jgi:hypothetical protein
MQARQIMAQSRRHEGPSPCGSNAARRPTWHDLAHHFTGERECLASYLALEAAEVIGGAKPANLLNLLDWQRPCGRNIYRLWRKHGHKLLAQAGLAAFELAQRENSVLLLIYHPERLAAYLETPKVTNFLRRAGYHRVANMQEILRELQGRCTASEFPHEIGAILGYPLKDVAGFMGWVKLPVTHQGPWKIFGDPRSSLAVIEACRDCRDGMARRLQAGSDPFDCLGQVAHPSVFLANN